MKKSGVTVHILEPGVFSTNFARLDVVREMFERSFNNASQDIRQYYGEEYKEKSKDTCINYETTPPLL